MATSWSKDTSIGSYGSKMRVRVNVVRQSLSGNYTRVKVRIYAYNGGRNSPTYNQGDGASVAVSGDASHSDQVNFRIGPRSWGTLADWEFNVPHDADGRKSFRITGKLSDTGTSALGNGGSITITGSLAPLYLTPKAPSWGATSYRSADTVKVSWNRRSSARGRYDKLRVQRWARSTGKWYHRALLSGSATSYTDTSLSSNDEHQWRVRAEGPGGTSDWVSGGTLGTMPSYPTNVHAVKDGQSIRIGWTDKAAGTNRTRTFIIADNPDGAGWVDVGTIGGSAQSWTHTDADPSVTHQYKVATQIRSQITLTSNYSAHSNVVQLQAAPKQPARLGPSDSGTWEIGDTLALQWEHLAVDTTAQTSAEVWWRIEGGDWNTTVISGAQDSFEVTPNPAGARARLEWRVRTKGAHPDWSPWSSTNGPLLSTRPLVLLQAPVHQEPLETSRLLADWTYEPGGSESQLQQSEWVATLSLHGTGTAVENQAGSTASSAELQTRLANQTEYVLQLSVRNGDGLWSEPDQSVFTTDFPLPAIVEAFPEWDPAAGAVSVGFGESEELRASYRWTGEPHASTSEMVQDGEVAATNLVTHPLGPTASTADGWVTSTNGIVTFAHEDERPAVFFAESGFSGAVYVDPVDRPTPPVGTVVRWAVSIKVTVPVEQMRIRIVAYSGAEVDGGRPDMAPQYPEDGWVRYEVEATVTAMPVDGYLRTLIWPASDSLQEGEGFYIRDALVVCDPPEGVRFFDGDSPGVTDVDAIDVERRQPDGSWLRIASGIGTSSTITDRTPHIGDVEYRAVSRTVLPTEQEGPAATASWVHDRDPVFVNGSSGMDQLCLARGNQATDEHSVQQELHRFAGQARPTAFFGPGQDYVTTFAGRILPHPMHPVSSRADWVALLQQRGLVCFRDCQGRKLFGVLSVSFTQTGNVETVNIEVQEATHDESVQRVTDAELQQRQGA